eukprot:4086546-Heterocapsa_arctica.AAC.1
MEEAKHTKVEKTANEQCQKALLLMGFGTDQEEAMFKAEKNSRHGWAPHTAIHNWLLEEWGELWTQD